ncbi:HNH endonuclease [Microbacterium phage Jayden]|uniref:HNH endonuclease n=1 Tax=Microbacterium phage Jayden TaxID=2656550 RepID=A0A649VSP4_9CAUD|nr:HNH endonuclease [Microbacterium phage Jayden]QGJ95234.1 HNH endonuclease [Microbacterium phage Jayden]
MSDPGPKPKWAEGNPLVNVRACPLCGKRWWEHDHSVAETVRHLHERHPDWDDPQPRLQPTPG